MPMKIISSQCTGCSACEQECPNVAISEKDGVCYINPKKCTECLSHYDTQQCVAVCPMEGTIVVDTSLPRYKAVA
ncbi:MAG TPA: 4Fe-4S binding protein [Fibrobacteria bacterium]|nr:4Fe-4S binding protein [Fibrobacteria bacterium]